MSLGNNIFTYFQAVVIIILFFCNIYIFSNSLGYENKENANISDSVNAQVIPGKTYIDSVDKEELIKANNNSPVETEPVANLIELYKNLIYPEEAKNTGIEGKVIVKIYIDIYGKILKSKIFQSSSKLFEQPAIDAIMKISCSPATQNNKPVGCWLSVPITFKLEKVKEENYSNKDKMPISHSEPPYDKLKPSVDIEFLYKNLIYPEEAKKKCIEGKVLLNVFVDKRGIPQLFEVVESDSEILNQAAIDAAKNTIYTPAIINSRVVGSWVNVPIEFKLKK